MSDQLQCSCKIAAIPCGYEHNYHALARSSNTGRGSFRSRFTHLSHQNIEQHNVVLSTGTDLALMKLPITR